MSTRTRTLTCGLATALTLLALASPDPAQAAAPSVVNIQRPRVDVLDTGRIVVSFDAAGDIRGIGTLLIDRDASGTLRGEWVLVSRFLRDLTPDGQPDPLANERRAALQGPELHRQHTEYFDIYERGTLRGTITGGALSIDVDGGLRSIDALQLSIANGNLEFTGWAGDATLTTGNLRQDGATGTLTVSRAAAPAAAEGVR